MMREIVASQCGIIFDEEALRRYGIDLISFPLLPAQADPEKTGPDAADAVQPIYDELQIRPMWWILEVMPMRYSYQDGEGRWKHDWRYDRHIMYRINL
jgi:hypothetical protein